VSSIAGRRRDARRAIKTFRDEATRLREALRSYERALDRVDRELEHGTPLHQSMQGLGVLARRDALVANLDRFETARHRMRVACFRVSIDDGLTIADVARLWGVSRQLVSRMLHAEQAGSGPRRAPGTLPAELRAMTTRRRGAAR
jgi:hypothetical protein